jgi:hypothetical protein
MKKETQDEIRKFVLSFLKSIPLASKHEIEEVKKAYPFHAAIFSEEALIYAKSERSIVTKMGQTFYPELARIIANENYNDVYKDHKIEGKLDSNIVETINRIVSDLRANKRKPNHDKEMKEILLSKGGKPQSVRVICDLFVGDFKPGPLFFEIKSPMPNLDVCDESKRKILLFLTLLKEKNPQAYFAFAYNPYVTREKYAHSFTKQIMDLDKEILMGNEMWDKLGGKGTYEELLKIIREVKESKELENKEPLKEFLSKFKMILVFL